jgi:hypothetical protein
MKDIYKIIYDSFEEEIKIPAELSEKLEKKIDGYITEGEAKSVIYNVKERSNNYYKYIGIAATVVLFVGLFFIKQFNASDKFAKETFKDPVEAEIYAKKTLALVSANLNKGLSSFEKVKENIDNANKLLNNILTIK